MMMMKSSDADRFEKLTRVSRLQEPQKSWLEAARRAKVLPSLGELLQTAADPEVAATLMRLNQMLFCPQRASRDFPEHKLTLAVTFYLCSGFANAGHA